MTQSPEPSDPAATNGRFGRWMIVGAWVLFLILLTLLFTQWLETRSNPNRSLNVVSGLSGEATLVLKSNPAGHFLAPGEINGVEVTFLLDTGATRVAVPAAVAADAGLARGVRSQGMTAGGMTESWLTRIARVRLGPFEMEQVQAAIIPDMPGSEVLLGMSFLRHLRLEHSDQRLRISLPD